MKAFGLPHGEFAVVEDRRRQHRVGPVPSGRRRPDAAALPTPPEAITGTARASDTRARQLEVEPCLVPSRSMLVSRISAGRPVRPPGAPTRRVEARGRATAVRVDLPACPGRRPGGAARRPRRRCTASRSAARVGHQRGFCTAEVLIEILSRRRSAAGGRPPPCARRADVSGMKTCSATASITCRMMSRWSELAVMSRNVSSSAPARRSGADLDRVTGVRAG